MELIKYFSNTIPIKNIICFSFFAIIFVSSYSQDSIFNNINKSYEESIKRQNQAYNLYADDFSSWKNKVDLKKINLDPEKAIVNSYIKTISDRDKITNEINKYIGVPYLWGGENPNAFDCSGLIQWTLKKSIGISIPRTTNKQFLLWKNLIDNKIENAKQGDLLYFKTFGSNPVSHVGVFIGNNTFIHSPKKNDFVKKAIISGYWKDKFVGFLNIDLVIK
jgi:cell wall-associated NlpC family hydrolase